LQAMAKVSIL